MNALPSAIPKGSPQATAAWAYVWSVAERPSVIRPSLSMATEGDYLQPNTSIYTSFPSTLFALCCPLAVSFLLTAPGDVTGKNVAISSAMGQGCQHRLLRYPTGASVVPTQETLAVQGKDCLFAGPGENRKPAKLTGWAYS